MRNLHRLSILFAVMFSLTVLQPAKAHAQENAKDVILVLDVSRSMIGYGNNGEKTQNIFDDIKKQLRLFTNELNPGDTLQFISFGTDVYQLGKFSIEGADDINRINNLFDTIQANDQLTYTAKMLELLNKEMNELKATGKNPVQIAVIFTDAIDDPPQGEKKISISGVGKNLSVNQESSGYVYYMSLNPEISDNLQAVIASYFPEVILRNVSGDGQLAEYTQEAIDNLKPLITVDFQVEDYKPFESRTFPVEITANKEAAGLMLDITMEQGQEAYFSLSETSLTLEEGVNRITLTSTIPVRHDGEWAANVDFKIDTLLESLVKPSNPVEVKINALPLSIQEKLTTLPEYYITLAVLIIALLVGLYFLIKYLTFVPVLSISFWETVPEELGRIKASQFDPFSFEVTRSTVDLVNNEKGSYLISSVQDESPFILLEGLTNRESFNLKITGDTPRKRKVSIAKEDKMKIALNSKKNFKGRFAKDNSYFRVGNYSFVFKTNIK